MDLVLWYQVANAVEVILAAPKKVPEGTKDSVNCLTGRNEVVDVDLFTETRAGLSQEGGLWKGAEVLAEHQAGI